MKHDTQMESAGTVLFRRIEKATNEYGERLRALVPDLNELRSFTADRIESDRKSLEQIDAELEKISDFLRQVPEPQKEPETEVAVPPKPELQAEPSNTVDATKPVIDDAPDHQEAIAEVAPASKETSEEPAPDSEPASAEDEKPTHEVAEPAEGGGSGSAWERCREVLQATPTISTKDLAKRANVAVETAGIFRAGLKDELRQSSSDRDDAYQSGAIEQQRPRPAVTTRRRAKKSTETEFRLKDRDSGLWIHESLSLDKDKKLNRTNDKEHAWKGSERVMANVRKLHPETIDCIEEVVHDL